MKLIFALTTLISLTLSTCAQETNTPTVNTNAEPVQTTREDGLQNAYFASGCFWCVEAIYEHVKGVKEVVSGYAGGYADNPSYRQVGSGTTGHSETVEVQYDPKEVDYKTLVEVYYGTQDPTTYGQAPDFGSAYRSMIFYQNSTEKEVAENFKAEVQKQYNKPVKTEIVPFQKFFKAEKYHQDYERLNPNQSYIIRVSKPRLERFKTKFPNLVKSD